MRAEGCTEMQGYLFSRPMRAAAVKLFIADTEGIASAA